jgi:hypothetical protein
VFTFRNCLALGTTGRWSQAAALPVSVTLGSSEVREGAGRRFPVQSFTAGLTGCIADKGVSPEAAKEVGVDEAASACLPSARRNRLLGFELGGVSF